MTLLHLAEAPPVWLGEPPPEPVNESELSWIWAGQRYPSGALNLVDGRSLRVLNPGRPGGGAGPDFLDASLVIDGAAVRGDVELHVRASGFRAHGHDADPNYDGVALHVVFRADDGAYTRLASGGDAPVAAFAPWFDSRRDELQHWLGAEALWREPCCDAAGRLGEDGVRLALREAGLRRFETKSAALSALCAKVGEAEALWRTLFDVMGVGGDRDGFRRLAVIFPEPLANAVLASHGTGGLAAALTYVAGEGLAAALDVEGLPLPLRPSLAAGGRPANRPQRRLAGIAALYARAGGDLPAFARAGVGSSEAGKAVVAAWQVAGRETALLGSEQARELTLNLALPFAWNDPALRPRAEALLTALGAAAAYGKTAFLERTLRANGGRRPVRSALEQQGLLAYLGEWCSQGGCGRCPLS